MFTTQPLSLGSGSPQILDDKSLKGAIPISAIHATYEPKILKDWNNTYFLLTEVPTFSSITSRLIFTSFEKAGTHPIQSQTSFIALAKTLLSNAKPMQGKELEVLLTTISKQKSSNPTSLL